ncbi:hypothetical protein E2C01_075646 [Portunus trituberculatus]|uniref:Uncharacterized protein n=1 Tax=Portunus trituberculatus TaxID=210409 RepID=A0A5B7IGB4_PORTR|nr:hypothetical protein [Portunus trituberculatus]
MSDHSSPQQAPLQVITHFRSSGQLLYPAREIDYSGIPTFMDSISRCGSHGNETDVGLLRKE